MALHRRNVLFGIASLPMANLLSGRSLPSLTATVYNGHELHTALHAAGPGSVIELASGDFGDVGRFVLTGGNISVRARSPRRTVLRSPLVVNGDLVDLEGLAFEEGLHLAGAGLRIAGSVLTGKGIDVSGVNAEVTNCQVRLFTGRGISIKGSARNPRIHWNYLSDSRGSGNGHEAIQVGQSTRDTNIRINALVEHNRIERCTAESETISVKSSGNTLRNNILISSCNISNRHGQYNTYENNTVSSSYWIAVHDRGNKLRNNKAKIRVMGGNVTPERDLQGGHPQAYDTDLSGNSGLLVIGSLYSDHRLPAVNTTVTSHNGPIQLKAHVGTTLPGGSRPTA
jgi:hypothetical protein